MQQTEFLTSSLCSNSNLPLITSPQSLPKLLKEIGLCKEEEKVVLIEELVELVKKCKCNQLALVQKNFVTQVKSAEDFDLLLYLIETIMKSTCNRRLYIALVKLFKLSLHFVTPLKRHYEKVYELLALVMNSCKKEGDATSKYVTIQAAIELLEELALHKQTTNNEPKSYLYFIPKDCGLVATIPPKTLWPFHKGFTIIMILKPDTPSLLNGDSQLLFRLCASTVVIECNIKNYSMFYTIQSDFLSTICLIF